METWISGYWGKARPSEDGGPQWHPLAYHSLDVAAALEAMLDLRPQWLAALARQTRLDIEEARRRLLIVAALHDLGKFADNFQQKVPELGLALKPNARFFQSNRGHGDVGASIWRSWLAEDAPMRLDGWMIAAFSHHGAPVEISEAWANDLSEESLGLAVEFAKAMIALMGTPSDDKAHGAPWLAAGLVILADWIGSNQAWFPYCAPEFSLADYWETARRQAKVALNSARIAEAEAAQDFDLKDLLGEGVHATPLQTWSAEQKPDDKPQLYLIEDLTGAGKTEAALLLAHRLMRAGAAEGIYWALPTMATANGLYARLEHAYHELFTAGDVAPSLVLAHSARDLHQGFQASIGREGSDYGDTVAEPQNLSAEAACAAFVAEDRKKTFLAQVGVGTLDQALLAVLPVRHQSLRLAGLCRRVLVVDEAHAYDPYVSAGLERLLQFHAALGGSAIVLSATLTKHHRRRFLQAYGAAPCEPMSTAFPLATHAVDGQVTETALSALRGARRDLKVRRLPGPETAMQALLTEAEKGACGVYVRNTVQDALEAMEQMQALAAHGVVVELFHSRYANGDRLAREAAVLERFGKGGAHEDRAGRILVATQVVEQSLDLDFDFMASDLCPMDLLIQRAGRLHRHARTPTRPPPELWLVGPEASDEVASDWYGAAFPRGQWVYPDAGQLWRTQRLLAEIGAVNLASGSPRRLIEVVFGEDTIETPDALNPHSDKAEARRQGERAVAQLNLLNLRRFEAGAAWGSDVRTPTRLGEETLTLRLVRWSEGRLRPWCEEENEERSWRLSEINVPARRLSAPRAPSKAAEAAIIAIEARWSARHDPTRVLALSPGDGGTWTGAWTTKDCAGEQRLAYDAEIGLRVIG